MSVLPQYSDTPIKQLIADGEKLTRYLQGRHIPKESRDLHKLRKQLLSDVIEPLGYKKMSEIGTLNCKY